MTDITIRPIAAADYPFVKATWLKNFRDNSEFAKPLHSTVYFRGHSQLIDGIFRKPTTQALIAVHKDEPDIVFGFMVYETSNYPVVHYAYVSKRARGLGIAKDLLAAAGIAGAFSYTHRTKDAKSLAERFSEMTYDPYRV